MFDIEDYTKKEVVIGEVKFVIGKLNAFDGFYLLEALREKLGESLGLIDLDHGNPMSEIIAAVLKLPADFVKTKVMPPLFENINYQTHEAPQGMKLKGTENMAFQTLEPIHVYELLARALSVNFYHSFAGKLSGLKSSGKMRTRETKETKEPVSRSP